MGELPDLLDASGVAAMVGVSRSRVIELDGVDDFPRAITPNGFRVWSSALIERWAFRHPSAADRGSRPVLPVYGALSPAADHVLALARSEASGLNHPWVGPEHVLIALTRPGVGGVAGKVLESVGLVFPEVRLRLSERFGDAFEPFAGEPKVFPPTRAGLRRANCHAQWLCDEEVRSEHILLALAGRGHADALMPTALTSEALCGCVRAAAEGLHPRRSEAWVAYDRPLPGETFDLALTPGGLDPKCRRPWTYPILHDGSGQAMRTKDCVIHYTVDRDGFPVRTADGLLLRPGPLQDGDLPSRAAERPRLEPFDPPPDASVTRSVPKYYSAISTLSNKERTAGDSVEGC